MTFEELKRLNKFVEENLDGCQDEDFWEMWEGKLDLSFSINDDPRSDNYGNREIYAYRLNINQNGDCETDTSDYVRIY